MPGLIQESPFKTITVQELHPTFAAEVSGVNFQDVSEEQFKEIIAAMAKYGVCVFRNTGLDDEAHVKFSERLGELDNIKRYLGAGRKARYDLYELFDAGNIDSETGGVLDPNSARAHSNRGNGLFHADSTFNPRRASFSLLRACELPPPGNGGNTDFADSRTAFDELPQELKEELLANDYVGAHSMAHSRKLGSPEFFADVDPTTGPMQRHRIAQVHEPSGRMNLYIGAHLHHIEDADGNEIPNSWELVEKLNKHATQRKYTTTVQWDRPSDMIIWDNRCVLHRAGGGVFEGKYRRDLRRTTVHDDSPTAWGLNSKDQVWKGFNAQAAPKHAGAVGV
ncbi:taurine catabolism dioxygenase [Hypoxylon trugodes]|uniref:taurine catabolism dioxygenase n=1 Tax=Hypoxylon trugodes TaxID=326681 RepID=UPI00219C299D|nr:taurine catabolism dioxygenase [Hypoxylon trugodes]KAI1387305.1 taurine catabolism dioxygenase [Hypoxylon trugodes]